MPLGASQHPDTRCASPLLSQPSLPPVLWALCFHCNPPSLSSAPHLGVSSLTFLPPSPTPARPHCLPPGPSHAFPFCCARLPRISHPHILPLSSLGLDEVSLSPRTGGLQNPAKGLGAYAEKPTARCCLPLGGPPRTLVCLFPCLATCLGMGELQGGFWL